MHPSVVLSIWFSSVLLAQVLPPLALVFAGLSSLAFAAPVVRQHFVALLKRSRWILLTLFLTFVFLTPGERWLPGVPVSHEGLLSAGSHLLRLLAVLLAVAWLIGGRSAEWLLSAMWGVVEMFRGRWGTCFIVRLALTLRYAGEVDRRVSWRESLIAPGATTLSPVLQIRHVRMSLAEQLLAIGLLFAGAAAFLVIS